MYNCFSNSWHQICIKACVKSSCWVPERVYHKEAHFCCAYLHSSTRFVILFSFFIIYPDILCISLELCRTCEKFSIVIFPYSLQLVVWTGGAQSRISIKTCDVTMEKMHTLQTSQKIPGPLPSLMFFVELLLLHICLFFVLIPPMRFTRLLRRWATYFLKTLI